APIAREVASLAALARAHFPERGEAVARAYASWALLSLGDDELLGVPPELREAALAAQARAASEGRDLDRELIAARYAEVDAIVAATVRAPAQPPLSVTERLDRVLTHPV